MAADDTLPEGTDHVINGASETGETTKDTAGKADLGGNPSGPFFGKFEDWRTQGYDRARNFAVQGKDRATGALDDLLNMITEAAQQVDDKIGSQYGDYARRASSGLGSFNQALKDKDVDELFTDARDIVAKAPAVAVGAAAALGFIVARLAKAGMEHDAQAPKPKSDA